jgi:S1-C subfamily serine protease
VMMYDGRISKASILGYCPFSDVAVLKLDVNPSITPLALGDSSKIIVGQPVLALGSPGDTDDPLALRDTLTLGIVSQINRYVIVGTTPFANFIQVDTPINFGNSGGPLIDSNGKVVGVVQSRIDPTQGDGISYAISSNKVKRVVESIISKGSFPYPYMGVGLSDITPLMAVQKSLDTTNGALLSSVVSGGPGAVGGLQTGDVIVSIDGVAVRNIADLTCYLGEFKSPGDIALVQVMRGTAKMAWPIMVGTRPPN